MSPTPAARSGDDSGMDTEKGLYTTFSFQDNKMPFSIGGTTALAKIDTGSGFNVILKRFLDTLPVYIQNKIIADNSKVMCANGTTANVLGQILVSITILGHKISAKFHVMEGDHNDIYLGMPFLKKHSAILTFDGSNNNSLS